MTPRPLSDSEQDFLNLLQQTMANSPSPLDLDRSRTKAIISMIFATATPSSPAETSIGPVCETPMLAEWLGISRQGVNKGVRERRILGVQVGRAWHYPTWQLGPNQVLPAATSLFKHALPPQPTPVQLASLAYWAWNPSQPNSLLEGKSPATWIQENRDVATLLRHADQTWNPQMVEHTMKASRSRKLRVVAS
ncbi:MAG: hypothetical protein E7A62_09590 [Actinomycetaceae bacterium]|nr:hypothetical protein [Actinomycetaceae bacterium]MDU0971221.1 hypothetical protein [Actinomycetaceae bacterium]